MDSQPDEGVLKEKQDNGHSPHQSTKKLSLQGIYFRQTDVVPLSLEGIPSNSREPAQKRQRVVTRIMPPVPIVESKKPVHNLVPDSEALCVTPSHFVPVFSNDRANQTPSQSNPFTSPSCTADSVRLMKDELVTRDLKPQPNLALSLNHHVRSSPDTDDLLGALDSMPSLVTIVAPKLSILTEKGTDSQANSSVSREALTKLASADRLLSPLEARQPIVHHVAASGIHTEPVCTFREIKPETTTSNSNENQSRVWSTKRNISVDVVAECQPEERPPSCAQVKFINLVSYAFKAPNLPNPETSAVDYKRFVKVWPVNMQRGELVAPENRGKSCFIVNLAAYASRVDESESSVRVSLQVADDEERERINRMFE
ncbi:hypothetical protein FGIG_02364 [Fasciola gigantica]|uniref:Uncharacterized protein n=1 Tax=Fasciola gigantica TaxID=46835 RepID=A0A504Y4S0_FASGI|nr:hypothetical protein FGIG_02364 [Fasciola gigantica]